MGLKVFSIDRHRLIDCFYLFQNLKNYVEFAGIMTNMASLSLTKKMKSIKVDIEKASIVSEI